MFSWPEPRHQTPLTPQLAPPNSGSLHTRQPLHPRTFTHSHPIRTGSSLLLLPGPREREPTQRASGSQAAPYHTDSRGWSQTGCLRNYLCRTPRSPSNPPSRYPQSPLLLSNPGRSRESGRSFMAGSSPASQFEAKASPRPTVESKARSRLLWRRCPSSSSQLKST